MLKVQVIAASVAPISASVPQRADRTPAGCPSLRSRNYVGRRRRRDREQRTPSLEKGIVNVFVGIGFIVAALAIMPLQVSRGHFWGWSFFFPRFRSFWAEVLLPSVAAQRGEASLVAPLESSHTLDQPSYNAPSPRLTWISGAQYRRNGPSTCEREAEGTTHHLGAEAPTRQLDSSSESHK